MSGPPRQAFAYARVSTEDQADEGLGIVERGWELAGEIVDAGVSGAAPPDHRPALGPTLEALVVVAEGFDLSTDSGELTAGRLQVVPQSGARSLQPAGIPSASARRSTTVDRAGCLPLSLG